MAVGRLTVLQTSPRVPPGLLSRDAWQALERADEIATADRSAPLASSLTSAGFAVVERSETTADMLVGLVGDRDVVWIAADDGDPRLTAELAAFVVRRSEGDADH